MRVHSWICLAGLLVSLLPGAAGEPDAGISFLEKRTVEDPDDFLAWAQLADRYLQRLRETGNDEWLRRARTAAQASLGAVSAKSNPTGLSVSARVALAEHRFADARQQAEELLELEPGKPGTLAILTDALLESGNLGGAEKALAQLEELNAPILTLASRSARLCRLQGDADGAKQHYAAARAAAEESNSAFWSAWAEIQLGELAFSRGQWDIAEKHYAAALQKQPRWWTAQEHVAELRAAQERDDEALELYRDILRNVERPELLQAVGDLHLFRGRKEEAKLWHERALAAYERSVGEGSVSSFHHLSGFFCDSQRNPVKALEYARKDLQLRDTGASRDALAWALYHAGDIPAAGVEIAKALAINPRDSHVLYHSAMIRMSAGDIAGGQAALREAAADNPRFQSFHVHR
jgi:tetratricopeptide (TPR) repeat protein